MTDYAKQADKLIEVYLNWILSSDLEAGWHQPSKMQAIVDFEGDLPPPTGNDQLDLKMIHEVQFLREPHHLLPEARELIGRLKQKYREALLIRCRYAGTVDLMTGKYWTNQRLADEMEITLDQFKDRVKVGRRQLIQRIEERAERNERIAA